MADSVLTIAEVAKVMRVSPQTIYNLMRVEKFPTGFKVGRVRRWQASEIEAFMSSQAKSAK